MSTQFFDSAEYRGFNRSNAAFVTDLYQAFFQRAPDAGGLAYRQTERPIRNPMRSFPTSIAFPHVPSICSCD
jgi:hypothetical protein